MQVKTVVDHFHFKSHKGAYCHTHTNPYSHQELKGGANLSVCEQRFKYIAQHKKSFRYMNQARFNFMLAVVVCGPQSKEGWSAVKQKLPAAAWVTSCVEFRVLGSSLQCKFAELWVEA